MVSLSHISRDELLPLSRSVVAEHRAALHATLKELIYYPRSVGLVETFDRYRNALEDHGNADELTLIYNIALEK